MPFEPKAKEDVACQSYRLHVGYFRSLRRRCETVPDEHHVQVSMFRCVGQQIPDTLGDRKCSSYFTGFTVNSFASRRHRYTGNEGPSAITALGQFQGGRLRYWEEDQGKAVIDSLPDDEAMVLELKDKVHFIDGHRAHGVEDYEGDRTSIVWYTHKCVWDTEPEVLRQARAKGFRPPSTPKDILLGKWFAQPMGVQAHGESLRRPR